MHSSEKERLLHETLRDANYEEFRAQSFAAGLRVLRLKNRRRRAWRLPGLAAMITVLLALILGRSHRTGQIAADQSAREVPRPNLQVLRSVRHPRLEFKTAPDAKVAVVETKRFGIHEAGDEELIRLFPDRPVAFVRQGGKTEFMILGN